MRKWWRDRLWAYGLLVFVSAGLAGFVWLDLRTIGLSAIRWHHPWALLLLTCVPLLAWVLFHLALRRSSAILFSRTADLAKTKPHLMARLARLPSVLRVLSMALIAVAVAGPLTFTTEDIEVEGIDIMIALDLSKSMEEHDLARSRLDAGQRTIRRFLRHRSGDRVGLVVFADGAMLAAPLSLDYPALDKIVSNLSIGDVPDQGTAIGDGLGLALASLRRSDARSKMVILLSDGDEIRPPTMDAYEAKNLAKEMGVRVFTVLLGKDKSVRAPGERQYRVDPELLVRVADDTGGQFFRAGDDAALSTSFEVVRQTMEQSRQRVRGKRPDQQLFFWFAGPALVLLLLEILGGLTRLRRFP